MKGYCGIDCEQCECYIATQKNDDIMRLNIAIKWSKLFKETILPREINCQGCHSNDQLFRNCKVCKIRQQYHKEEIQLATTG